MTTTISGSNGIVFPDTTALSTTPPASKLKAFINFKGTGTLLIRDSFNISSVTDNGVGNFNVNFANALATADYVVNANSSNDGGGWTSHVVIFSNGYGTVNPTVNTFKMQTANNTFGAMKDNDYYTVSVVGN